MPRTLTALLVLVLLCGIAATTHAAGINLYWNDCSTGGSATTNRDFACNTNVGFNDLYISYSPPPEITAITGVEITINLQLASATLQDWWRLSTGTCRPTALTFRTSAPSSCPDPWAGQGVGGIIYQVTADVTSIPTNGARIRAVMAVPDGTIMPPLVSGTEYFGGAVRISNAKTVGPTSCAGCSTPVCMVLSTVGLYPPGAPSSTPLFLPLSNNFVGWQGGTAGPFSCFGPTPALNRTWGQLKTLYR